MAFLVFLLSLSLAYAQSSLDLSGVWYKTESQSGRGTQFISVGGSYYFQGQDRYVFPNGALSHTIDQAVKLEYQQGSTFSGKVDFFDSRGCSYTDLKVVAELKDEHTLHVVMTVPRYQFVTTTTSRSSYRYRPRYCPRPYPYRGYYICGSDREIIRVKSECRLLNLVKVPVELTRF